MPKVYILDSSVLLHDPTAIYQFQEHEIVIPYAVLEELEHKKRLLNNIGRAARETVQNLDQLREKGQLSQGVKLKSGGVLRIELNHSSPQKLPLASDLTLPENRILSVVLNLRQEEERPVILVTKDIAMRVKADALGLATQDYFNDKVYLPPLGDDVLRITPDEQEIKSLYSEGAIKLNQAVPPNACVLAENTSLPLVSSTSGREILAAFGHKPTWEITPRNLEQHWALALLNNPGVHLVNLMGPAGTGKTLLALASGLEQTIHSERYARILCARPVVPLGKDIGYLPGEKDDKVRPYMQPIYDNLDLLLRPKREREREKGIEAVIDSAVDLLKKKKQLEVEILTYIRGRSIPNQFIIIDEAQNLSAHEVKTIITRAGEGTKIVLCGDPDQIDHPYLDKESNGMTYVAARLQGQSFYGQVRLVKGERSTMATIAADLL
ncbi:PhoH family protein [Desulfosporosinus sp. PR]|uniref:PhoH family protein n=1 Tax=Candidatus Desulfosporosinus nitrosoreducens TaxID=3401928 RepID=UPI0027EBB7FB|nr:PhoH family protein [Desulfosporosinus sp. PR]MDQ7092529.1 PhoH family protein [Desulfosporosinus sp. PR]